jgi:quinol monooxygenase YgiN
MNQPKIILRVKFKTDLPMDRVMEIARERADDFRALSGLCQKYYFQDPATGEIGGLYLWDSDEALDAYRRSKLRASIASAYRTIGEPQVEILNIFMPLRETINA